ncbi:MAG: hypothetical protein A3B95_02795 [Candidatus Doudnabacteria bacterium RIFCSPHIGHO2_02_FULL_43_13b]|nr:MAG: hypothetical protein A3B95_02795 [Candidatus Doudnabacteria bacterium RIFCSPHIGHO2_02_FULL_43_13b]
MKNYLKVKIFLSLVMFACLNLLLLLCLASEIGLSYISPLYKKWRYDDAGESAADSFKEIWQMFQAIFQTSFSDIFETFC